jgi:HNH endonuclease
VSCGAVTTVSDESPSSATTDHDDENLSKAAADGRKLIDQREATRKKEETPEEAASLPRDSHGRIKRSWSARKRFLLAHGLIRTPPGRQVDHVVPLGKGGSDVPANMQLLCGEALREKEASELR